MLNMTKIAVILVLLGLTVMASAYSLSGPRFNRALQTGQQNEQAYLQDQGRDFGSLHYYYALACYFNPPISFPQLICKRKIQI